MRHASIDLEHNNRKYKPQFESERCLDPAEYNYKPVDSLDVPSFCIYHHLDTPFDIFMSLTASSSNDLQDVLDEVGRLKHYGGLI